MEKHCKVSQSPVYTQKIIYITLSAVEETISHYIMKKKKTYEVNRISKMISNARGALSTKDPTLMGCQHG